MQADNLFEHWCENATQDSELAEELAALRQARDMAEINDRFYCELAFGTGGLRGAIGAGTNRMNVYTVRKATQGLANYLLSSGQSPRAAIAYDSRNKSEYFAQATAEVFAANGIETYMYSELMPTPALSFAVRKLFSGAGVCITASHNPAKYNGYKVYGSDGCQITNETAKAISKCIDTVDPFTDIQHIPFEKALAAGNIRMIAPEISQAYIEAVLALRMENVPADNLVVTYTPLNGAGLKCVRKALYGMGIQDIHIVPQQEHPDGNFPTCKFPNPEKPEAMELGLELAGQKGADILLATDPDCDRVGVAVRTNRGYRLLSGNEIGVLMLDYICRRKSENQALPENSVAIKTIVTTEMANQVAAHYGVELREVLTGFKYIGEQIELLEKEGRAGDYLFGFEESYGYLSGSHVRDKDGVNAAVLVCDMAAAAKRRGNSLAEELESLFEQYGFYLADLLDFGFDGAVGMHAMQEKMEEFRNNGLQGLVVLGVYDYRSKTGHGVQPAGVERLPQADVLEFALANGAKLTIRPSGTEPKMKIYLSVKGTSARDAENQLSALREYVRTLFQ